MRLRGYKGEKWQIHQHIYPLLFIWPTIHMTQPYKLDLYQHYLSSVNACINFCRHLISCHALCVNTCWSTMTNSLHMETDSFHWPAQMCSGRFRCGFGAEWTLVLGVKLVFLVLNSLETHPGWRAIMLTSVSNYDNVVGSIASVVAPCSGCNFFPISIHWK